MAFVAFGNPFPFAIQAYLWVMHGAAFALAFFFGAGLFVRLGSLWVQLHFHVCKNMCHQDDICPVESMCKGS